MSRYRVRLDALFGLARDCRSTTELRDLARLMRLGLASAQELFDLTRDPSPSLAVLACWAIARLGYLTDRQAIAAVCSAASHRSPKVRAAAARALLAARSRAAVVALRKLTHDRATEPAIAAIYSLGHMGRPADCQLLCALLTEAGRPRVRDFAAEALGNLGDQRAARVLRIALADCSPCVRKSASYALEQIDKYASSNSRMKRHPILQK
jgi:HEAT repeat protein